MEDYSAMMRNAFQLGSVRDAEALFNAMLRNAFPTLNFRRIELIRFSSSPEYLEGRSWNHVFEIFTDTLRGSPVWKVQCRRVTMGRSPDKTVFLDYSSLGFVSYDENT